MKIVKSQSLSGYPLEKLKSAIELSTVKIDVVLTYCKYTLNDTELLDYLSWFQEQGIGVINASPFAMGLLTDLGTCKHNTAHLQFKTSILPLAVLFPLEIK